MFRVKYSNGPVKFDNNLIGEIGDIYKDCLRGTLVMPSLLNRAKLLQLLSHYATNKYGQVTVVA